MMGMIENMSDVWSIAWRHDNQGCDSWWCVTESKFLPPLLSLVVERLAEDQRIKRIEVSSGQASDAYIAWILLSLYM